MTKKNTTLKDIWPEPKKETMKTRAEHLEWCKQRAMEYIERGDSIGAFKNFLNDMGKHHETMAQIFPRMLEIYFCIDYLPTESEIKGFINDFN